eukprot:CAMPEP_0183564302 /NCGR_PEP_ID=MMETSP0371-20130417/105044_1 /TAXON_ID=268820 /ORGANISM="Peridinium aciculiferum, Strain PAER-2" /LENGTH=62 /DNA_ID=CAMNT_0025773313 /DNA_START=211 /DNA_END=395 /DNA_ORIENTATION=+
MMSGHAILPAASCKRQWSIIERKIFASWPSASTSNTSHPQKSNSRARCSKVQTCVVCQSKQT